MLQISRLTKAFRTTRKDSQEPVLAVDGLTLTVQEGHMFTLLGPSGCGKTTTLRCVAGLERPDSGEVLLSGKVLSSSDKGVWIPVNDRGFGVVFQSYAIWPHMNVFNNVAFPLQVARRGKRVDKAQIRKQVMRVLEVVQLDALAKRPATDLSGGQQQRLALARAVVLKPPLLLLDEPLSNLDAKLRAEMRFELKRLQEELGITTIYVTHDQSEALAMSDVIALMNHGVLEQVGPPRQIYQEPASYFVADFIGSSTFVDAKVRERLPNARYALDCPDGRVVVTSSRSFAEGDPAVVGIRPEYVEVHPAGDRSAAVGWRGTVDAAVFQGESLNVVVRTANGVRVTANCKPTLSLARGDEVVVGIPSEHCYLVSKLASSPPRRTT